MAKNLNFTAQESLLNPKAARRVTLIGAGSVGSHVAFALAKMGVPAMNVWDHDDVSEHNVPISLYRPKDFMRPKVDALREIIEEFSGLKITTHHARYEGQEPLSGAVIVCVDTMDARQKIWKSIRMNPDIDLLIDTRTAGKLLWVFAICPCDPDDVAYYDLHTSYGTTDAQVQQCGRHGFMPMSYVAAACVAENLTTWWMSSMKKLHHKQFVAARKTAQEENA